MPSILFVIHFFVCVLSTATADSTWETFCEREKFFKSEKIKPQIIEGKEGELRRAVSLRPAAPYGASSRRPIEFIASGGSLARSQAKKDHAGGWPRAGSPCGCRVAT